MAEQEILAIADELYALALPEFTPARDARAKEHKGTPLAAEIKALKKPSLAAWVVNLLVRQDADQVAQVLTVGTSLREAAANLDGAELRALTKQRRQLTAAVTTGARALASSSGVKVTPAVSDQVEATLTAAMLDEDCASAVRSGLLVSPLASTGVDAVDVAAAVALPEALGFEASPSPEVPAERPALTVVPDPEADTKALRAAEEALVAADAELEDAESALGEAQAEVDDLEARTLELQAEIDELKHRLAELEQDADDMDDALEDAEAARDHARATRDQARSARDEAAAALERLS